MELLIVVRKQAQNATVKYAPTKGINTEHLTLQNTNSN